MSHKLLPGSCRCSCWLARFLTATLDMSFPLVPFVTAAPLLHLRAATAPMIRRQAENNTADMLRSPVRAAGLVLKQTSSTAVACAATHWLKRNALARFLHEALLLTLFSAAILPLQSLLEILAHNHFAFWNHSRCPHWLSSHL
jgi:hypothetical protein